MTLLAIPPAPSTIGTTPPSSLWLLTFMVSSLGGCLLLGFSVVRIAMLLIEPRVYLTISPIARRSVLALWTLLSITLGILLLGGGTAWPLLMRLGMILAALTGGIAGYRIATLAPTYPMPADLAKAFLDGPTGDHKSGTLSVKQ